MDVDLISIDHNYYQNYVTHSLLICKYDDKQSIYLYNSSIHALGFNVKQHASVSILVGCCPITACGHNKQLAQPIIA